MTSLNIIDAIEVATPCPADWSEMLGGDKVRFCGSCEKNVYNFAAMTRPELVELIEQTEGVFCGRLYRRADGTVLTVDCPVGLAEKARRASRRAVAAGLYLVTLIVFGLTSFVLGRSFADTSCDARNVTSHAVDKVLGPPVQPEPEPELLGRIAPVESPPPAEPMWVMGDVVAPEDMR